MQKIAIIQISEEGKNIARLLLSQVYAQKNEAEIISRTNVGKRWKDFDAFVFIGAMGICVRTIAPYIKDKHEDPAVVCVDSMGLNVISVLSGHVGGANDLTRDIAAMIGAHEVITTQSDNAGLWALDTFEQRFDWPVASDDEMNDCIFAFVNREPTALLLEVRNKGTDYLETTKPEHVTIIHDISEADPKKYKLLIMVTPFIRFVPWPIATISWSPTIIRVSDGRAASVTDLPTMTTKTSTTR